MGSRRRLGLSDVFYGKECKACREFQRVLFILRLRHRQSLFARIMGKRRGIQLTDEEYYVHLKELAGDRKITALIVDPSAASFIETVKRHNELRVIKAQNDVLSGINRVCQALKNKEIFISPDCTDTIREFSIYRWDNDIKRDAPRKENDHAMDDIRYFVNTVLSVCEDDFSFSVAVERK